MVDVESGLKYPLRGEEALKLHAIGGGIPVLLNLVGGVVTVVGLIVPPVLLLLVPLVPVHLAVTVLWTGFYVRVAGDTLEGRTEPPVFDDWGELARDGFWGSLVILAYLVPGFVLTVGAYLLMFLFVFGASFGFEQGFEAGAATAGVVAALVMLFAFLVVMVYGLLATYLLPISLVAYADERRLGAAFSTETLRTVGANSAYVKPWAAVVGVYVVVYTVVSALTVVLVGYLLAPFLPLVYFYLGVAAFYMFTQSYAETTGVSIPATESVDEPVGSEGPGSVGTRPPEDV